MPRTTTPPDPQRQLMIKTKACQRLMKEVEHYKKEVQENEMKLNQMKQSPEENDEYDIKRFQQILDESYMMVPDAEGRFQQSTLDLKNFLDQSNDISDELLIKSEWYPIAQSLLLDTTISGGEVVKSKNQQVQEDSSIFTPVDTIKDGEMF